MSEILYRSKSTEWIRALFGGLLSVLVAGAILLLLILKPALSTGLIFLLHVAFDMPGILLHTWLIGDPFAKLLHPAEALVITWRILWLALIYWFFAGFALAYFIKDNRKVVIVWLLTVGSLPVIVILVAYRGWP